MTGSATVSAEAFPDAPGAESTSLVRAQARPVCRETIAYHGKSFALASRLLPPDSRDDAAIVYTWCRRVDDAIDEVPAHEHQAALERLHRELDDIYRGDPASDDPALAAFAIVVRRSGMPRDYPQALLDGMAMDASQHRYHTLDDLLLYCHRVAGVVGLMMAHVFGVRSNLSRRPAAQLGIGMQLTNICRDVVEDAERGRVYLPLSLCKKYGVEEFWRGTASASSCRDGLRRVVGELLELAERYYRAAEQGYFDLPFRASIAVRAARAVYSEIGSELARRDYDVTQGRAYVSTWRKLILVGKAALGAMAELPARIRKPFRRAELVGVVEYPNDILLEPTS